MPIWVQPPTFQPVMNIKKIDVNSPTWGGLPRWNTDGSKNSYDRARSTAPDWLITTKR